MWNRRTLVAALCVGALGCSSSDDTTGSGGSGPGPGSGGAPSGVGGSTSDGGESTSGAGGTSNGSGGQGGTSDGSGGQGGTSDGTGGQGGTSDGTGGQGGSTGTGGQGGAGGTMVQDVTIFVANNCDVTTVPASISVKKGTAFTVNWIHAAGSQSNADVAKIDQYNQVPIIIGMTPGSSYHDTVREWCGNLFSGTFDFRITGCYNPTYLPVDCDG